MADKKMPKVSFDGPKDLKADWKEFYRDYVDDNKKRAAIEDLELFNEFIFKLPEKIANKDGADATEKAIDKFIERNTGKTQNYEDVRGQLYKVAKAIGDIKAGSDLNKAVANSLAGMWLGLEEGRNLETIPEHGSARKTDEWKQHTDLQRSEAGGLVFGTLMGTSDSIMKAQSKRAAKKFKSQGVSKEEVEPLALDTFQSTLYRYEGNRDATFFTYLTMRLEKKLPRAIAKELVSDGVSIDAPRGKDKEGGMVQYIEDRRSGNPEKDASTAENVSYVRNLVETHLSGKDKKVIVARYGLADEPPKGLKEVANDLDISLDKARQIKLRALKILKREADLSKSDLKMGDHSQER